MSEPIVQRIQIDADQALAMLKQVAQSEDRLAESVKSAGNTAGAASKPMAERNVEIAATRGRLQELRREEMLWEASVALGHKATEADTRALMARRSEMSKLTGELREHAAAQTRTADAMKDTGKAGEGLGGAIGSMVVRWTSWAVVIRTVLKGLEDVIETSKKAAQAFADTGKASEALAHNIGGERNDQTWAVFDKLSNNLLIGDEGRDSLVKYAAAKTDVDKDATQPELEASIGRAAKLYKATGQGGATVFKAVNAIKRQFGVSEDRAFDIAAFTLNSGFTPDSLYDQALKSQSEESLALYVASQKYGLDADRMSRATAFEETLHRTDESGQIAPELAAVGITTGMTTHAQRIAAINAAVASGRVTQAQVLHAIGGESNLQYFSPESMAVATGEFDAVRKQMAGASMDEEIATAAPSKNVQAYYRARDRKLREKQTLERSMLRDLGEGIEETNIGISDKGSGSWWLGLLAGAGEGGYGYAGAAPSVPNLGREPSGGNGSGPTTIIHHQINNQVNSVFHAPVHPSLLDSDQRNDP